MSPPKINVTPLIDVLLVLLIIFMVVAPLRPSAFEAKLPIESNNDTPIVRPNKDAIVVSVDRDLSISMNEFIGLGTPDDTSRVTAKLQWVFSERELRANEVRVVFIRAPRNIQYGDVVKVIDAVKLGGAQPLALQIDRLE
jgi:biopolymer transport protein ExbD